MFFSHLSAWVAPLCSFLLVIKLAAAQSFLPPVKDVTVIESRNYPGVSISYKETSICETTAGVKGYSGFVTLPSFDKTYNASIFFWYFESRKDAASAPTTVYLPGGPGTSFLDGASGFPCSVDDDGQSTSLNPWSWNNEVNMLYIDVPCQTGFSYTNPQNGTFDFLTNAFSPLANGSDQVATNLTTVTGTLSSQSPFNTLNTTAQVARQVWRICQVWFQEFPEHKTTNDEVNIWSYSYSGFFAPETVAFVLRQNERIANGTIDDPHAKIIRLGTLGINNGCIDVLIQGSSYPEMAVNNTYGIEVYSHDTYEQAKANITKEGGCNDLVKECRALQAAKDPLGLGDNDDVNTACQTASLVCFGWIQGAYLAYSNRSAFDLALNRPGIFPPETPSSFYNQRWVQEALGVPVNFTLTLNVVGDNFFSATGDPMIPTVGKLDYLLSSGVNLAMVYGDRDYRCNWLGAEQVSLAMSYPSAASFRSAGYTNLQTNASYVGGLVRQHGNVSFSRVFEAGHSVAASQPETVYRVFRRAIFGRDIATGDVAISANTNYSTTGPSSSFGVKNVTPPSPPSVCWLYQAAGSCTEEQQEALRNGTAVVKDYVIVWPPSA